MRYYHANARSKLPWNLAMLPDLCVVPEERMMSLNDLSTRDQVAAMLDQRGLHQVKTLADVNSGGDMSARTKERAVYHYDQEEAAECIAQIGMYVSTNDLLLRFKKPDQLAKRVRDANLKGLKGLDRRTKDEFIRRAVEWLRRTDRRNRWSL